MNDLIKCTKERKKQLAIDLWIIAIVTFIVLGVIVIGWGNGMTEFAYNQSINIVIRVLVIGICGQFGIAGLGITIVCLLRHNHLEFYRYAPDSLRVWNHQFWFKPQLL